MALSEQAPWGKKARSIKTWMSESIGQLEVALGGSWKKVKGLLIG